MRPINLDQCIPKPDPCPMLNRCTYVTGEMCFVHHDGLVGWSPFKVGDKDKVIFPFMIVDSSWRRYEFKETVPVKTDAQRKNEAKGAKEAGAQ